MINGNEFQLAVVNLLFEGGGAFFVVAEGSINDNLVIVWHANS